MLDLKQRSPLALPGHHDRIQLPPRLLQLLSELLDDGPLSLDDPLVPLYLRALNVIDYVHLGELSLPLPDLSPDPRDLVLSRADVALHLAHLVPRQLLHLLACQLSEMRLTCQMLQLDPQLSAFIFLGLGQVVHFRQLQIVSLYFLL